MADRQRVYHPVTGEPFDVPLNKAIELRLNHGWLSQVVDPEGVPYVTTVEAPEPQGRVIEVGCEEACEASDGLEHRHERQPDAKAKAPSRK